ncbi:hypothetical protein [Streptomyces sp. NPDC048606]|uniref:COG1470 family protein n=1 Tax=Streptomyces sp. NPDC048606 TaxID=3154726 RepID=UPI00344525AE
MLRSGGPLRTAARPGPRLRAWLRPAPGLALAVGLVLGLVAAPAVAADGPGWSVEPAGGRPGAPARPYFYLAGTPGTVLEDRLALTNTTDRERVVTLRGADAPAGRPGGSWSGAGAGSWIGFAADTVRIPPRTRAVVPFTVSVPPASTPGDHPAVVVAGEAGREVDVRIHLRVGGPTLAALTVEDVSVRGRGAATVVAYTLVNRGNVVLTAPVLAPAARGRLGDVPAPAARTLPVELPPGGRLALTEPWPDAPALDRVDLTLTVTAPGAAPAGARTTAWFLPGTPAARAGAGLIALGGALAAGRALLRARRSRRRRGVDPDRRPAPGEGRHVPHHELTGATR